MLVRRVSLYFIFDLCTHCAPANCLLRKSSRVTRKVSAPVVCSAVSVLTQILSYSIFYLLPNPQLAVKSIVSGYLQWFNPPHLLLQDWIPFLFFVHTASPWFSAWFAACLFLDCPPVSFPHSDLGGWKQQHIRAQVLNWTGDSRYSCVCSVCCGQELQEVSLVWGRWLASQGSCLQVVGPSAELSFSDSEEGMGSNSCWLTAW